MSKEFLDRLARGELTDIDEYRRMKQVLHEMKTEEKESDASSSQEWQNWELSPVWSAADVTKEPAQKGIVNDNVHRALDLLDKQ